MIKGRWNEQNIPEPIIGLLDSEAARKYFPRALLADILNMYDLQPGLHRVYCVNCGQEINTNPLFREDPRVYKWVHIDTGRIPCYTGESGCAAKPPEDEKEPGKRI